MTSSACALQAVERAAAVSVGRATAFSALGICCLMIALSYDLPMATQAGAVLGLMTSTVLWMRGSRAHAVNPRETETWMMLRHDQRPPKEIAQHIIGRALRRAYFRYARIAGTITVSLWLMSVAVRLVL